MRFAALALAVIVCVAETNAQSAADQERIRHGLAERTQKYYDRFISIICTETVHTQDLRINLAPTGRPRTTVYELSVSRDPRGQADGEFRVERILQSVNGRPARKNQTGGCTDPKTGTPEPLSFLMSSNQHRYRFSIADSAGGPSATRAVDFIETRPERVRVSWQGTCFEAEGGGHQGRVWFDPDTYDVHQVVIRLSQPFVIPMPDSLRGIRPAIRVEKSETTLRFSRVEFQQPDESVMLPTSIDTLHVLRGVPSIRIRQSPSDYRRFLTRAEIRPSTH